MRIVELRCADSVVQIAPDLGGAVLSFEVGGRHVLRPTPSDAAHVLQTAHFVLAPYANRIADGRFRFGGHDVHLPANSDISRHPLHGNAWLHAWDICSADSSSARLLYRHTADAWPWAYSVRQDVTVSEDGLMIALSLCNNDVVPMPGGLGFHPYFPRTHAMRLSTQTAGVWLSDGERLPTSYQTAGLHDWSNGARLSAIATLVDHCHDAWSGVASLTDDSVFATRIEAEASCDHVHIFVPPSGEFLCVEPVTHRPDPFSGDAARHGIATLQPGEILKTHMSIRLENNGGRNQ